ncbi:MAG: glycoside hydrolase family 2 protein [Verrucomicrobia bacterium]|nr:glycoside hydrolase family 2 protein [Verrucomicrobiota bacterium]MCH8511835.1 glycoside hydrolase family 2 protein [Kiritimatiellia bacterium]
MQKIDLNGPWSFYPSRDPSAALTGNVPGCVHTDLLALGKIPDPWFRDNEKDIHWVAHEEWVYARTVEISEAFLAASRVLLCFDGLDTLCTLEVNGKKVAEMANMHLRHEVDVKSALVPGENRLQVTFHCPFPLMREKDAELRLPAWNLYHEDYLGKSYVRKMACAFGWDWGLMAPTVGIWRPASLIACENRVRDVRIVQRHAAETVALSVSADVEVPAAFEVVVRFGREVVVKGEGHSDAGAVELKLPNAELWWPNGMGAQPLYDVEVRLANGAVCARRIGLRTIELVREADAHGESFRFRVNGRDVFAKGGNWIPCDVFPSRVSDDVYRHLLESCARSGMNMIRVWGGGIYEDERFYDLCDELGLMIWQDFMFACSTYPGFDPEFLQTIEAEAVDNVRRLRHRACLALWCGNNELEQGLVRFDQEEWNDRAMPGKDYTVIFDELLPAVVDREDGVTPYWPCSPHSPFGDRGHFNNPACGDAHAWSVWFGGEPLEAQRKWDFRFMSEFGFQSFPELRTVESFTEAEDRSLVNWVMDYHQRSGPGNMTIYKYLLDWFREPGDFESALVLTQLIQALCIQVAAEHARRIQGQMDGLLYWQINDLWPGATWSSIDVYGRWKALQYFSRRFFAPVLVSLLENCDEGTVACHVSNHRPVAFRGELHWQMVDASGAVIEQGRKSVEVPSQCNERIEVLSCQEAREAGGTSRLPLELRGHRNIPMSGDRDLLVFAVLTEEGVEISRNLAAFAKPKYWKLRDPGLSASVGEDEEGVYIDVSAQACAPWTRLHVRDGDIWLSDNFFHVLPGFPVRVRVESCSLKDRKEIESALLVTPLLSLFR